jgi:phosphoserine phosphatase
VSTAAAGAASPERTLLVTVTGRDRPGVTERLFTALEAGGAHVLDVEQVVVRGHLTLAALLDAHGREDDVADAVVAAGRHLDLRVQTSVGTGDNAPRPAGRLHVTLIGRPLPAAAVAGVARRVAAHGANIDRVRRLARDPVVALELDVSGADADTLRRELAAESVGLGVDVAVWPAGLPRRGRRLVVMDVDSTLITGEVIELLAEHAGRREEVAAVTERAMRGEIDFAESLHARVACLAGLDVDVLDRVREAVRLTPGAATLVRTLHRLGFAVALVSGGFVEVVGPLAAGLGVRHVRANALEVAGGRLTGRVSGTVVDRAGKARALRELAAEEGVPLTATIAVGDGANDLDMLAAAGTGIAFNAKPAVRELADAAVSQPYLDSVLYLLGISREDVEDADADADADHPRDDQGIPRRSRTS